MLSDKKVAEFIGRLPGGKARVYLDPDLWDALYATLPHLKAAAGQREMLSYLVDELCRRGYERPKNTRLVDRTALPVLPLWLAKPESAGRAVAREVYIFRSQELAFLNDSKERIKDGRWQRLDAWFLSGGASGASIPARERSLEIFGDEKAIDSMTGSIFFKRGAISPEALRCFHVPEPIPYTITAGSRTMNCLVLENATTYFTFRKWNEISRMYSVVAYGGGNAFSRSWEGLSEIEGQIHQIEYFGDIDGEGLRIPWAVSKSIKKAGLPFRLSRPFYETLLKAGEKSRLSGGRSRWDEAMAEWLADQVGNELAGRIVGVIRQGRRIPQEYCTAEMLHLEFKAL